MKQPLSRIPAFNDVQARLEAAFERLPAAKSAGDTGSSGIRLKMTIPAMVREVYFAAAHGPEFTLQELALKEPVWPESEKHKKVIAVHSATRAVNRGKVSTAGQARQQITDLKNAFSSLSMALGALQKPAIDALTSAAPWAFSPSEIEFEKYILMLTFIVADVELPEIPRNAGMGRTRNKRGLRVASKLGHYYKCLTGSRPTIIVDPMENTAKGPFLLLVKDVFTILGITESAESNARAVANAHRQGSQESAR